MHQLYSLWRRGCRELTAGVCDDTLDDLSCQFPFLCVCGWRLGGGGCAGVCVNRRWWGLVCMYACVQCVFCFVFHIVWHVCETAQLTNRGLYWTRFLCNIYVWYIHTHMYGKVFTHSLPVAQSVLTPALPTGRNVVQPLPFKCLRWFIFPSQCLLDICSQDQKLEDSDWCVRNHIPLDL